MKLYGLVEKDGDGWYYISAWFFSPKDREKYMKEKQTKENWYWEYEINYWFTEIDTTKVSYIDCRELNEFYKEF